MSEGDQKYLQGMETLEHSVPLYPTLDEAWAYHNESDTYVHLDDIAQTCTHTPRPKSTFDKDGTFVKGLSPLDDTERFGWVRVYMVGGKIARMIAVCKVPNTNALHSREVSGIVPLRSVT